MSANVAEKDTVAQTSELDAHDGGYHVKVDSEVSSLQLKTARDGKTILIPQPSDDSEDPLNWSWSKKHLVLLSLFLPALLSDFGMTWGTTLYNEQAVAFNMSVGAVANSLSGGIFLQGPGGVFAVPFAQRYGRLPVLFWSQILACIMVIGASQAPGYASFTALRTLQGWFNTAPQVIGLSIVGDMFFFHERAKRVNAWAFSFVVGPFFGPFLSAFIIQSVGWRATFGILASFYGLSTVVLILIGDETLYDRRNPQPRPKGILGKMKLLTGIAGFKQTSAADRPSMGSVWKQTFRLGLYPNVFAVTAGFLMITFMWAIGIVTTVSEFLFAPPYLFEPTDFALFFLGPTIGAIVGEIWGHFFNEVLRKQLTRRSANNVFIPESRLWGCYPAFLMAFTGLILYGQGLQHGLTWFTLCLGWCLVTFGMVSGTTAVSAYLLDCYHRDAAIVSGILNFWRTTGGFCVSYFQLKWVARNGAGVTFGVQAAILGASFGTIILVQILGRGWRLKQPEIRQ